MDGLIFAGGIAYFGAVALYFSAANNDREATILKSVARVNQLKDLSQLLDAERLPLLVTISGQVASENPIKCEITGLKGVIVEERVEQLYLKKEEKCKCAIKQKKKCNDADFWTLHSEPPDSWTQHSKFISRNAKEVPWYLDDGTDRVHVAGARGATAFVYPVARSKFDASGQTLVCDTMDSRRDKKILGLKRIEWVLPVGFVLTVVGEASKDDDGSVRIQRPREGPFYVSYKTIDELIANFENFARWCIYISVGLTVIGTSLIAACVIESQG
ncbi:E3 ubiquitin-protein ligase SP1 [Trifolium repens]|nr:E3 ubiquitin-protein ligase SP1 [Trifolium repens]